MSRLLLIIGAMVFLVTLPGGASAHNQGKPDPASQIEESGLHAVEHDHASNDPPTNDGPCCGMASCSPLNLATTAATGAANANSWNTVWRMNSPPAGPTLPIISPPG
jgi:hypothetical protein